MAWWLHCSVSPKSWEQFFQNSSKSLKSRRCFKLVIWDQHYLDNKLWQESNKRKLEVNIATKHGYKSPKGKKKQSKIDSTLKILSLITKWDLSLGYYEEDSTRAIQWTQVAASAEWKTKTSGYIRSYRQSTGQKSTFFHLRIKTPQQISSDKGCIVQTQG